MQTDAVPDKHFAVPPYRAEVFKTGWACVVNTNGYNCLTFPSKPGAKFTTAEQAEALAKQWNSESGVN